MLLHNRQDLDDDLGGRSDQDLSLSSSFGVDDVVQAVVKDGDSDHFDGLSADRMSVLVLRKPECLDKSRSPSFILPACPLLPLPRLSRHSNGNPVLT